VICITPLAGINTPPSPTQKNILPRYTSLASHLTPSLRLVTQLGLCLSIQSEINQSINQSTTYGYWKDVLEESMLVLVYQLKFDGSKTVHSTCRVPAKTELNHPRVFWTRLVFIQDLFVFNHIHYAPLGGQRQQCPCIH
jgi:hypothetical protein